MILMMWGKGRGDKNLDFIRSPQNYSLQSRASSFLNEAASTLQSFLPNDIVLNNILPFAFREMPSYTFQGEEDQEEEEERETSTIWT